jgi:hypothetical protein
VQARTRARGSMRVCYAVTSMRIVRIGTAANADNENNSDTNQITKYIIKSFWLSF